MQPEAGIQTPATHKGFIQCFSHLASNLQNKIYYKAQIKAVKSADINNLLIARKENDLGKGLISG